MRVRVWIGLALTVTTAACGASSDGTTNGPVTTAVTESTTSTTVSVPSSTVSATSTAVSAPSTTVPVGDGRVELMSFNVRSLDFDDPSHPWADRRDAVVTMLDGARPEVVGVQEAVRAQVDELAGWLDGYEWVGVGRDDGDAGGEYAAIFYDAAMFELLDSGWFWLSETPDVPSLGWDAASVRIATWAELTERSSGMSFTVVNTHFDHEGNEARRNSSALVAEFVTERGDQPVFVTGDLNFPAEAGQFEPLSSIMMDARLAAGPDDGFSFNSFGTGLTLNIDFIFHRNSEAFSFETLDDDYGVEYISDHYPILASLSIN